jgi:hypothetical protein
VCSGGVRFSPIECNPAFIDVVCLFFFFAPVFSGVFVQSGFNRRSLLCIFAGVFIYVMRLFVLIRFFSAPVFFGVIVRAIRMISM